MGLLIIHECEATLEVQKAGLLEACGAPSAPLSTALDIQTVLVHRICPAKVMHLEIQYIPQKAFVLPCTDCFFVVAFLWTR
jgi:hypothetical protein